MTLEIRKMILDQADIEGVIAIDHLTFKECSYSWMQVRDKIDLDQYPIYVAEVDQAIIGFIAFMKVQTLHYSGLWIDLVAVAPAYQGRGIAKELIQVATRLSNDLGVDFRSALVREDNISSSCAFEAEGFEWDKKLFRLYFKEE